MVITKDPDSGWVNWGMYRLMVHDATSMGGLVAPSQHIGLMYYQKYEARGRPLPFAVAISGEPVAPLIAAGSIPVGVNEADIIGGLRGEPLEVMGGLSAAPVDSPAKTWGSCGNFMLKLGQRFSSTRILPWGHREAPYENGKSDKVVDGMSLGPLGVHNLPAWRWLPVSRAAECRRQKTSNMKGGHLG